MDETLDEAEIGKILEEIESSLTGDAEQDADIWFEWGERYRGKPGSEPLLSEIGRRIFALAMQEDDGLTEAIYNDMVDTAEEDYAEACRLIDRHEYDEAIGKLLVLSEVIRVYPLPENMLFMDFDSELDVLIFRDHYEDVIGGREIWRHPMHPSRILYTTGALLIEMGRAEEAVEILDRLLSYDPVCPRFLFEMGEAYKRTGQFREAARIALWSLRCAGTRAELARGYRDLAYCMSETGSLNDAAMLYMLSLHYQTSRMAEAEIHWIRKKAGIAPEIFDDETIRRRCAELNIPIGFSPTVLKNQEFLRHIGDAE